MKTLITLQIIFDLFIFSYFIKHSFWIKILKKITRETYLTLQSHIDKQTAINKIETAMMEEVKRVFENKNKQNEEDEDKIIKVN